MNDLFEEVKEAYKKYRDDIRERLNQFKNMQRCSVERLYLELYFCILAPQNRGIYAWEAVKELYLNGYLYSKNYADISKYLKRIRFRNNKAKYIVELTRMIDDKKFDLMSILDGPDYIVRHNLYKAIKGVGYKEASHFLRNIGYTFNLAIIDRHILRFLIKFKLIKEAPKNISISKYLMLEDRFRWLSRYFGLLPAELDLLLWAMETGYVFK